MLAHQVIRVLLTIVIMIISLSLQVKLNKSYAIHKSVHSISSYIITLFDVHCKFGHEYSRTVFIKVGKIVFIIASVINNITSFNSFDKACRQTDVNNNPAKVYVWSARLSPLLAFYNYLYKPVAAQISHDAPIPYTGQRFLSLRGSNHRGSNQCPIP